MDNSLASTSRSQKIVAAAVQYGLSLVSGLATFAGLKILQHTAPSDDVFSRLSLLILSFTTFQLISDLGTQTEFLRAYHNSSAERRESLYRVLIKSRLVLGFLVVGIAGIYSIASDFSMRMGLAFLCYNLAFIPFAIISSADSILLAQRQYTKAVFSRIARLISLGVFLISASQIGDSNEVVVSLASTASFFLSSLVVWFTFMRPLAKGESLLKFLDLRNSNSSTQQAREFIHGSGLAALVVGVISAQGLISHSLIVRTLGENQLTALNTSIALATPAVLAFQTLVQIISPGIASWTQLGRGELIQRYLTLFVRTLVVLVVMCVGLWAANTVGLVNWFFPRASAAVVPMCFIFILAHWTLNFATPAIVLCQYQKRYKSLVSMMFASAGIACLVQIWWLKLLRENAYLIALVFMGLFTSIGAVTLSLRNKTTSANS